MELKKWMELAEQNREVDFFYNKKKYSISVSQDGIWYLTQYDNYQNAQEFSSFLELINTATINMIPFIKICEELDVDAIY